MVPHAAVSLLGARAAGRSGDSVHGDRRLPHRAGRTQADGAGCGPGDRPRRRRRPRRCAHRAGDALHCLPVGGGRARHDNEPDRQRDRRSAAASGAARRARRRPESGAARGRGVHALGRAGPALDVPLHDRGGLARRGRHPGIRAGHRVARCGEPGRRALRRCGVVRHPPHRPRAPRSRPRNPPLSGSAAGENGGAYCALRAAQPVPLDAVGRRPRRCSDGGTGTDW